MPLRPQMQPMAPMSHGGMAPGYTYVNMPPGMMAYPGVSYQQPFYYAAGAGARRGDAASAVCMFDHGQCCRLLIGSHEREVLTG